NLRRFHAWRAVKERAGQTGRNARERKGRAAPRDVGGCERGKVTKIRANGDGESEGWRVETTGSAAGEFDDESETEKERERRRRIGRRSPRYEFHPARLEKPNTLLRELEAASRRTAEIASLRVTPSSSGVFARFTVAAKENERNGAGQVPAGGGGRSAPEGGGGVEGRTCERDGTRTDRQKLCEYTCVWERERKRERKKENEKEEPEQERAPADWVDSVAERYLTREKRPAIGRMVKERERNQRRRERMAGGRSETRTAESRAERGGSVVEWRGGGLGGRLNTSV
ncbi:hypothetical protein X777_15949, partial [Ooceraea biroi]